MTSRKAARKLKSAVRKNVVRARRAWQRWPSPARAAAPGMAPPAETRRPGDFYHLEVRPKGEFRVFRTLAFGTKGGIERVIGRRPDGSWATQQWRIGKEHAHVEEGRLVGDTPDARKVLRTLLTPPKRVRGDLFAAKSRDEIAGSEIAEETAGGEVAAQSEQRLARRLARRRHGERPPPPGAPRS